MAGDNWTMWLNITNYALGIVTLIALLLVFFAVSWDLIARKLGRIRERVAANDINAELHALLHGSPHSLSVPGLGLTMADGGERIEPSDSKSPEKKRQE
jgi:hypothetical protein